MLYLTPTETCTTVAEQNAYETHRWVSGEGAVYTIPAGVTVNAVKYRETGYDTDITGSFTCNDEDFKIVLDNTWACWDSPEEYAVTVSDDGITWSPPVARGHGTLGITTITFPQHRARWIRVTQTGSNPTYNWSIYELNVYRGTDERLREWEPTS